MVLRSAWFRGSQGMEGIQREVKRLDQQSLLFFGKVVFGGISGIHRRSDLMDDSAQSDNCVVLRAG